MSKVPIPLLLFPLWWVFPNLNFVTWPHPGHWTYRCTSSLKILKVIPQGIIDMKGWLTKLSVLTARSWNLSPLWTDNGLMEQDQMGCNQIGLHFELHPLQCRSQFQNKSKKVHYLLCMVELQSVTHMCGLGHNLCHHVCHRWGVWNGAVGVFRIIGSRKKKNLLWIFLIEVFQTLQDYCRR